MKHNKTIIKIAGLLFYCSICTSVFAGGPANVGGKDGNTPVIYENPNLTLNVENGDIGSISNADAVTLTQEALELWSQVGTSTINLSLDQTQIDLDVDQDNYEDYLPDAAGTTLNDDDNLNPVIFDNDGKIIEDLFGIDQSLSLLGFASSIIDVNNGRYLEGFVVLNGNTINSDLEFKLAFAHETGHFLGLDHSQINVINDESFVELPFFCFTTANENYPLMYPVGCRESESLHPDDISAISALYPSATITETFGILQGRFVDEAGDAILGANIWVENTASGDTYSIVSDYLKAGTGFYKLYIPAGSYTLHANSINPEFTGGSGVGPYASDSSDISFKAPHPIAQLTYHGGNEVNDEVITVTAGQTFNINFSSTGAQVLTASSSGSDDDDSFADLFGAMSHVTLLLLSTLLMFGRWNRRT